MTDTYTAQPVGQLANLVDQTLTWANEPRIVAKYTPTKLYPLIRANYRELCNEILRLSDTPFMVEFAFTVTDNSEYVAVPPNIGTLLRIFEKDTSTNLVTTEYFNRSRKSLQGPGFTLEGGGNKWLHLSPKWTNGTRTLYMWYIPNGDCAFGLGSVHTTGFTTTSVLASSTPTGGYFDTRPNVYLGSIYRLLKGLKSDGTSEVFPTGYDFWPLQERIITASSTSGAGAPLYTLHTALDFDPSAITDIHTVTYEIVPDGLEAITPTLALRTALTLQRLEGNTNRANNLQSEYVSKMRDIRLAVANLDTIRGNRHEAEVASAGMDPWGYAWNSIWGAM